MQHQKTHIPSCSFALIVLLGVASPARAVTWPFGPMVYLHPDTTQQQDSRLSVRLYNRGGVARQVKAAGRVYTVMPFGRLTLKAPQGTEVFAASNGLRHRKGDLLFAFTPDRDGGIVLLD